MFPGSPIRAAQPGGASRNMEQQAADSPRLKIIQRARAAFFREGFGQMTMTALADACGLKVSLAAEPDAVTVTAV